MELNIGNITIILSIVGSLLGIIQQMKSMKAAQEKAIKAQTEQQTQLSLRLDSLEKAVASHNNYAQKFVDLSSAIVEMKTDLRWIKDSLEK